MNGISFIVTVYNTEIRYLKKSISSIIRERSFEDEVIIVNDGSKINVSNFINRYKKNITIINNKVNMGISYSRNLGILKSSKKFITFVDSDDYIEKNSLKKIKKIIFTKNFDIFSTNFNLIAKKIIKFKKQRNNSLKIETVWGYFFKRKFLIKNKIFFNTKILKNEDQLFVAKCFHLTSKFKSIKIQWYNYRIHKNNISYNNSVSKLNHFKGTIILLNNLLQLYRLKKKKILRKMIINNIISFYTSIYIFQNKAVIKEKTVKKLIYKINYFFKKKLSRKTIILKFDNFFKKLTIKNETNVFIYCAYECSYPILKFLNKKKIKIKRILDINYFLNNVNFEKSKINHFTKLNQFTSKTKENLILITHPEKKTFLDIKKNLLIISKNKLIIKNLGFSKIFNYIL